MMERRKHAGFGWEILKESKIDLTEIGWKGVDWIYLAQDRHKLVGCCEHCNESLGPIKLRKFLQQLRNYFLLKKNFSPWSLLTSLDCSACLAK
jgi:hypothetical protein